MGTFEDDVARFIGISCDDMIPSCFWRQVFGQWSARDECQLVRCMDTKLDTSKRKLKKYHACNGMGYPDMPDISGMCPDTWDI